MYYCTMEPDTIILCIVNSENNNSPLLKKYPKVHWFKSNADVNFGVTISWTLQLVPVSKMRVCYQQGSPSFKKEMMVSLKTPVLSYVL